MKTIQQVCTLLALALIANRSAVAVENKTSVVDATDHQLLLCTLTRKNNAELVLVKDDGTEVKTLTNNKIPDTRAAWSPDGKRIVFSSNDQGRNGLFVIDADGKDRVRLTYGADVEATWSPDGKTIVFTRHAGRLVKLVAMHLVVDDAGDSKANGGKPRPLTYDSITDLTDGTSYDADPAFSPDGKSIVFASNRGGAFRIDVMDADGTNVRDLTQEDNPGGNGYPAWSPDGKRIAYTNSAADGSRQIFIIDADGKNKMQLTKNGDFNCYAAWSPDGKKIAFMSFATTNSKGSSP
jgi:TolB protein